MEMRAQSRQYGIYDIRNDALRFCAGLFTMIEEHIDSDLSGVGVELELNRAAEKALRHPKVETICQTALTGDVSTETADRELVNQEKAQTPVDCVTKIDNIEKTSPEKCLSKLKENQGMRSASWQSGTCHLVKASCAAASQYDKDVQNDFSDAAQVVLFKLAAR
ncbi:Rnasel [Symbiodinium sp. KB8]|nr:Rnasel [Symbiodinium sp. KB8]